MPGGAHLRGGFRAARADIVDDEHAQRIVGGGKRDRIGHRDGGRRRAAHRDAVGADQLCHRAMTGAAGRDALEIDQEF
ncbi:MAG: hypothetical protein VB131_09890 [Burkholderia gladioli]